MTEEPVSTQNDDLTAIFGSLGTDVPPVTPDGADPDDGLDPQPSAEPTGDELPDGEEPQVTEEPAAGAAVEGAEPAPTASKPANEPHIPPAVAKQLRQSRREAQEIATQERIARAAAEAELKVYKELAQKGLLTPGQKAEQPVEQEKSPLERFAEEFPDEAPTTKVLIEQEKWKQNQQQQQAKHQEAVTRTQTLTQQVSSGIQAAKAHYSKLGPGLDLDGVVGLAKAHGLISNDDLENCSPFGVKAGFMAYNLAVEAIKASNGPALAELSRRVALARTARPASLPNVNGNQPKPKPKQPNPSTPANAGDGSPGDETVNSITRFIFSK